MIRIKGIKTDVVEHLDLYSIVSNKLHVSKDKIKSLKLHKKSLDARSKERFKYVLDIDVEIDNEKKYLNKYIEIVNDTKYIVPPEGSDELEKVVVIGAGPAGLFASYMLSKYGYDVEVFERGEKIENRSRIVEEFWNTGKFNEKTNVQFGEGGAGTFSDGKLNTLTHDKFGRMEEVFRIFVECGADPSIMYEHMPHLGTDSLKNIVVNLRNKIIEQGGKIHYNSKVEDIIIKNGKVEGIKVNGEFISTSVVVLAIGHSARDTFKVLHERGVAMEQKPFSVGLRIIHDQTLIDKHQYPINYSFLPPSSYKLTYKCSNGHGVYSFCMCPGGYVVDARSSEDSVVVNGMSYKDRDSKRANSAIVVTVDKDVYGDGLFDGVKFQEELEHKAYKLGDGLIPVQKYMDYKVGNVSNMEYVDGIKGRFKSADLNELFPEVINESLKEGIDHFNTLIPGFNEGVLCGVESRTSSPIKIVRSDDGMSNIEGLYPCGEGSGYAGGITTSAIDGIKTFESIRKKYKEKRK